MSVAKLSRYSHPRFISPEARSIALVGLMEGCSYAGISARILKITGEKVPIWTLSRRRPEWLAEGSRAEISRVFASNEALAATRWRFDEIADLVAKIDRTPGSCGRRRTKLRWALGLFMNDPVPEKLHDLYELLLLFLFERQFDSSSLPKQAEPRGR